ncbi:MAG: radical SAM protein [Anaerolineae bacterium]|nr:radical SAM protein [Anaerolineae bacterium]
MKIWLLFPPHWTPAMPHLALPTLTAFLRSHELDVVQTDLNLEVFDALLTREWLEQSLARVRRLRQHLPFTAAVIEDALAKGPDVAAQVEPAKATFRSEAFFDGPVALQAYLALMQGLELASMPFAPSEIGLNWFTPPVPEDSSHALLQAARDPQHNLFFELFRRDVVEQAKREQPDIVAISIPTLNQMLAGLTAAYVIKAAGIPCHITAGGPHIAMLREQLPKTPALFDLLDSAIVFGGETPLLRLAEALDGDKDLSKVPNLIYREGNSSTSPVRVTPVEAESPPNLLPDFDGLPLERYLTPRRVLPLLSAHGCYHGKCGFCNVGYGGPQAYEPLDPDGVVESMLALRDRYGAHHIFFADEALPPRTLKVIASRLAGLDDPIHWCGCVRFDNALSEELLTGMARGGCRMLLFGLETAARSTIERMNKGTDLVTMSRVLRQSAEVGIWNHTFFFFGFPGETLEAAQETVNFVYAHQNAIHSASPGTFALERYSPVYNNPAAYGVRIFEHPDRDLAIYFDYTVSSGLGEAEAENVMAHFVNILPNKQFGQYYVNDAYRFLYAGHLHAHDDPLPPWLM